MTQPLGGDIVHYVFWDKNSHLFAMPLNLFRCNNRSLKVTVRLRREQLLEFGDNIIFTADLERQVIIDYEKTIKTNETNIVGGMYLVRFEL